MYCLFWLYFSTWLACYLLLSIPDVKCNHILKSHMALPLAFGKGSEPRCTILKESRYTGGWGCQVWVAFLCVKNIFEGSKETRLGTPFYIKVIGESCQLTLTVVQPLTMEGRGYK